MTGTDPGEVTKTLCMSGLTDTHSQVKCVEVCVAVGGDAGMNAAFVFFSESTQFKVLILN